MKTIAIILSGGCGKRFGAQKPKQFLPLGGIPILEHSVKAFNDNSHIDEICIVSNADYIKETKRICTKNKYPKLQHIIAGGSERYFSTLNALRLYKNEHDIHLLFHDAVRPLVSDTLISHVAEALQEHHVVDVCLPTTDTIVEHEGDYVCGTPNRSRLLRVQTPQGFHIDTLRTAYQKALENKNFKATDDCGVVAHYLPNEPIYIVKGEEHNQKLTYPDDLPLLEHLLFKHKSKKTTPPISTNSEYLNAYRKRELLPLQQKMLEMITIVTDILEHHDIPYWLVGGTLLGAMRHGGFIPWDDDMDIAILMEDEERMKSALEAELPAHLELPKISHRRPVYKVRDKNSFFVEPGDNFMEPYPKGIFVDLFLIEAAPAVSRGFARKIAKNYCRANAILHKQHYYSWRSTAELFYFGAMRAICNTLWWCAKKVRPMDRYITYQASCNGSGLIHEKSKVFPLKKVPFEDRSFFVPADPDHYLTEAFGNWKTVPPVEDRQTHATFYKISLSK